MTIKFSFTPSREGALFVYQYSRPWNEALVEPGVPIKIDQAWWDNWDFRPHELYNVSGLSPVQNAIYLALAWKLTHGLKKLGIPHWTRDDAQEEVGKDFEFVR